MKSLESALFILHVPGGNELFLELEVFREKMNS